MQEILKKKSSSEIFKMDKKKCPFFTFPNIVSQKNLHFCTLT